MDFRLWGTDGGTYTCVSRVTTLLKDTGDNRSTPRPICLRSYTRPHPFPCFLS